MYNIDQNILEQAIEFSNTRIRPFANHFDLEQKLPDDLLDELKNLNYLGAMIPKEYGGLGLDWVTYGLITEAIGMACCSVRSLLTVHSSLVAHTILKLGSKKQKLTWLPLLASGKQLAAFALSEEDHGSDALTNLCTIYTRFGDKFIINGKKSWVTFGAKADVCLVFAESGSKMSAFMVDLKSAGINIIPRLDITVNRASYLADIYFKNVEIPQDHLISSEGSGSAFVANIALESGRYSIAWAGVAIAHEALNILIEHTKSRKQFNKFLHEFQIVQGMIANAKTKLEASKSLCLRAGLLKQASDAQATTYINIAKLFSSQTAVEVTNDVLQILGAKGFSAHASIQRLNREAKLLEIIEGTTQIQKVLIAQDVIAQF